MGLPSQRGTEDQPGCGANPYDGAELRSAPALYAEIKAATRLGISRKRFGGWAPKTVTTVLEWDDQGRPKVWTTEEESEWDEDEREYVLALLEDEADRCPGCSQPLSESGHPDADPNNPERRYRYQVSNPIVCHSCNIRESAIRKWRKNPVFKDINVFAITRRVDIE